MVKGRLKWISGQNGVVSFKYQNMKNIKIFEFLEHAI
jgi:hypothetical protein